MKIHQVNEKQFINPTNPISIYILGLLWADGYILPPYSIRLTTTYPDANTFVPLFMKTGKWKYYRKKFKNHPKWKESCIIKTSNKSLNQFLLENDYQSKCEIGANKILSIIPLQLKYYWFRGFLDGDGNIHTDNKGCHKLSFSSSLNQNWIFLENLCKELNINYSIHKEKRKTGNSSKFSIYGKYKVIKFCEYIYKNRYEDSIGLERKFNNFLQLKKLEKKNRFKGVSKLKNGKWRAYTKELKHLGVFLTKKEALKCVESFFYNSTQEFL